MDAAVTADLHGLTIRRARPGDGAAMRQLAHDAYGYYVSRIGGEPGPLRTDYDAAARDGWTWVAQENRLVVGLMILAREVDHLLLENIAVAPSAQGRGIGNRLLVLAEEQARALDRSEVRLYTHVLMTENIAYYLRHGYRETHRSTEHGFTRAFFTKTVPTTRP